MILDHLNSKMKKVVIKRINCLSNQDLLEETLEVVSLVEHLLISCEHFEFEALKIELTKRLASWLQEDSKDA